MEFRICLSKGCGESKDWHEPRNLAHICLRKGVIYEEFRDDDGMVIGTDTIHTDSDNAHLFEVYEEMVEDLGVKMHAIQGGFDSDWFQL